MTRIKPHALSHPHPQQGIRLFKICMVAAVVCMTTLRSLTSIRCALFLWVVLSV